MFVGGLEWVGGGLGGYGQGYGHGRGRMSRVTCMAGVGGKVQVQRFRVHSPTRVGKEYDGGENGLASSTQSSWLVCSEESGSSASSQLNCALVSDGSSSFSSSGGIDAQYVHRFGAENGGGTKVGTERLALLVSLAVDVFGRLASTVDELEAWRGKHVVVIGGTNSPGACFAIHAFSKLGARVVCVTTSTRIGFDGSALTKLGADIVLDPRKASWSDELKGTSCDMVLDALSDEAENSRIINALPAGMRYISIMPFALKGSTEDGLMGSRRTRSDSADMIANVNKDQSWSEVAGAVLERVDFEVLARIPTKLSSMGAVLEAATWPRDSDSGARYGFPAPSVWGDTTDTEDNEQPPVLMGSAATLFAELDEAEESEWEQERPASVVSRVSDMEGLNALLEENEFAEDDESLVLFISSTSCKRCKVIKPQYDIIARELSEENARVKFALLEIGRDKEPAKFLNIREVPHFALFRRGARFDLNVSTNSFDSFQQDLEKALV